MDINMVERCTYKYDLVLHNVWYCVSVRGVFKNFCK